MTVTKTVERLGIQNQALLYDDIAQYIKEKGYSPSVEELAERNDLSFGTTHNLIELLETHGNIAREKGIARSIRLIKRPKFRKSA